MPPCSIAYALGQPGTRGTRISAPSRRENRPGVRNLSLQYEKFLAQSR